MDSNFFKKLLVPHHSSSLTLLLLVMGPAYFPGLYYFTDMICHRNSYTFLLLNQPEVVIKSSLAYTCHSSLILLRIYSSYSFPLRVHFLDSSYFCFCEVFSYCGLNTHNFIHLGCWIWAEVP